MVPEKSWKAEAILRLFARVVICVLMGALVNSIVRFFGAQRGVSPALFLALIAVAFGCFAGALVILSRPWRLETFAKNAVVLLLLFYGGLALSWWSVHWNPSAASAQPSAPDVLIAVLSFQGSALVMTHGFLREHQVGWAEAFGFGSEPTRAVLAGMALAFLFVPAAWGVQLGFARLLDHFHILAQEQEAVQVLRSATSLSHRVALGISAVLLAPLAEEILFRGILFPAIKQRGFRRLAWWGTSLFFGAVHFNLVSFVPLTILALGLVWLYENTGNLLAPIAAHVLFNGVNFAAVFVLESFDRLPLPS